LRSSRARNRLWYAASGHCEVCGVALDPVGWHADHVIPWRISRTTNQHDMAALCPACNLGKGGRLMINAGLRPFQARAAERFKSQSQHGLTRFLFPVTPGGGKKSLAYLAAMYLPRSLCNAFCFVTPRDSLRDDGENIPDFLRDYCVGEGIEPPTFRAAENSRDPRRGCDGYVTTYAAIVADPQMHIDEFERPGVRYCLILDESQFLSDKQANGWTAKIQALVDRATVLILMSGTLYRGDGTRVAFAPYKTVTAGEELDTSHPDWITIPYTRGDALKDKAILPIEFMMRDARGEYLDSKGARIGFSSFDDADNRGREALGIAVHGDAGLQVTRRMLDVWSAYRKARNGTAQALVIVDSQAAARDYLKWIKDEYPSYRAAVAISDDGSSRNTIRRYRGGKLDVLITVGMAYVGMDAPAVSHIALLAVIRTRGWIEQATARGVRVNPKAGPWNNQRCVVYTFDDPLMRSIVADIEREQAAILQIDPLTNDPSTPGGGDPGADRGATIGLYSEATDTRAHELNRVNLDHEMSAHYERVAAAHGVSLSPVETHLFVQALFEMTPEDIGARPAPVLGRREAEDKLRKHYENVARDIDGARGDPWGTTNRACFTHFGKSRTTMTFEELQSVWPWMQARKLRAA
jgi:superfamily II DNA or RNA helicase